MTLYVSTIGQGPPIVLLHGWGWHSGIWNPVVSALCAHHQLFLIDLPGFGHSELTLSNYTYDEIAQEIFKNVPNEAIWLGWSLGGMIAWWVAIHYPEKVKSLMTIASSPRFTQTENWPGVSAPVLAKFALDLEQNFETTLLDSLDLHLRGNPSKQAFITELREHIFSRKKPALLALMGGLQLLRDTDLRSQISQVQCPSLHIFGSHDQLVPVSVAALIEPHLMNGSCEIINRTGHMPFLTEAFRVKVTEFLKS